MILDVGGKTVAEPGRRAQGASRMRARGGKRTVLLRVKSGEATRFVAVPLGRG